MKLAARCKSIAMERSPVQAALSNASRDRPGIHYIKIAEVTISYVLEFCRNLCRVKRDALVKPDVSRSGVMTLINSSFIMR
jgi:hypothetical protein